MSKFVFYQYSNLRAFVYGISLCKFLMHLWLCVNDAQYVCWYWSLSESILVLVAMVGNKWGKGICMCWLLKGCIRSLIYSVFASEFNLPAHYRCCGSSPGRLEHCATNWMWSLFLMRSATAYYPFSRISLRQAIASGHNRYISNERGFFRTSGLPCNTFSWTQQCVRLFYNLRLALLICVATSFFKSDLCSVCLDDV